MLKLFEKMKWIPGKLKWITSKPGIAVLCLVAGFMVGFICFWCIPNHNPVDERATMAATVFGRLVEQNEMVTVSQKYSIVDKAEDTNKLFNSIDIPFTKNSFWYRYQGMIKAGVSLESAGYELIDSTKIIVTLEEPYIISNTPDMEKTGVLEENNNVFNPIHIEDVDAFQRQCVEQSETEALGDDALLQEARNNAEVNIANMFKAVLGEDCEVKFVWCESSDEPEQQAEEAA